MFPASNHRSYLAILVLVTLVLGVTTFKLSISPEHARVRQDSTAVTITCTADVALNACQFMWWNNNNIAGPLLDLSRGPQSQPVSSHLDSELTGYAYIGRGLVVGDCGVKLEVTGYKRWIVGCRVSSVQGGWKYAWTVLYARNYGPVPLTAIPKEAVVLPGGDVDLLCRAPEAVRTCIFSVTGAADRDFSTGPQSAASTGRYLYHGSGVSRGECGLTLKNATENDNGPFRCYLDTSGPDDIKFIPIIVARHPSNPVLNVTYDGTSVTASCSVANSRPVANLSWYLGDRILRQDNEDDAPANPKASWTWPWDAASITQNVTLNLSAGDYGKQLKCLVTHVTLAEPLTAAEKIDVGISYRNEPLIYDVTTIYRYQESVPSTNETIDSKSVSLTHHPGSVEVHARTNALGLPFLLHDGEIRGYNVGVEIPECLAGSRICHWTTTNFSQLMSVNPLLNLDGLNVLMLTKETGTIVSPPLSPSLDRACISLVYVVHQGASINLLLQQGKNMSSLAAVQTGQHNQVGAWVHQNIVVNIPERSHSEAKIVVQATKQADAILLIQRVAGCNTEEDVLVLSHEAAFTVQSSGVDVAHSFNYSLSKNNTCINGGLRIEFNADATNQSGDCACPAGFTGDICSEGCGANRYGADCGGMCSFSERGCRGMVLCRPVLGCACAPGFKSEFCDKSCDSGEYGVGCKHHCGLCVGQECNIYTGICHLGCQDGYFPPYCQQLYAYTSKAPTITVRGFNNVSVSANLLDLSGQGTPLFFQIQYKEEKSSEWQHELPQPMPIQIPDRNKVADMASLTNIRAQASWNLGHVVGLKPGTKYMLRVVLIDKTLTRYQGEHVPVSNFSTPCTVPQEVDYSYFTNNSNTNHLGIVLLREDGFEVEWKFPHGNDTWCSVVGYELEIKVGWQRVAYSLWPDVTRKTVTGLLSGMKYSLKVRAVTTQGPAAFSLPLEVTTLDHAPDDIIGLVETQTTEHTIAVSWRPPRFPAGTIRQYYVTYQCLHLEACPEEDCSGSTGHLEVVSPWTRLEGLLPYARYNISVAALAGSLGPMSSVQAATISTTPKVVPSSATPAILCRGNSSLVVQWGAPASCQQLNGYLIGYRYELLPAGQVAPLVVGNTTNRTAAFYNLAPHSEYKVRVFVVNSAGWSTTHALDISVKTSPGSLSGVQNLTVYKRGRRMLGLRWEKPFMIEGTIQSFTVSHHVVAESNEPISVTIKPSACPAWPDIFCHTISNLVRDTDYSITVQARNSENAEDGEEVTVRAATREGSPGAPSYLQVLHKTDDTMTIEWGLPDMINGQLRAFVINFEESDAANTSDCCQYFPTREVVVTTESSSYDFQMTGLSPAASYEISVFAKTITLGNAATLTARTRPSAPILTKPPKLVGRASTKRPIRVHLQTPTGYDDKLISGFLLLLVGGLNDTSTPLWDEWLNTELKHSFNQTFELIAEFTSTDLPLEGDLEIQPGKPLVNGIFGSVGMQALKFRSEYRLVWALVLDYCGALSIGHIMGEPFTVAQE